MKAPYLYNIAPNGYFTSQQEQKAKLLLKISQSSF